MQARLRYRSRQDQDPNLYRSPSRPVRGTSIIMNLTQIVDVADNDGVGMIGYIMNVYFGFRE